MHRQAIGTTAFGGIVAATVLFVFISFNALALDPPHDDSNGYGCDTCHDAYSSNPKLMPSGDVPGPTIDDTIFNVRCWSCHNPIGDAPASSYKTHSSLQADDSYGEWTVGCWVCHSVHSQLQQGQDIDPADSEILGKLIRTTVDLGNITYADATPPKSGRKSVIFKRKTGPESFADGDAQYNGVCEVCHTETTHFRNDGTGIDQLHSNVGGAAGANCTAVCHPHDNGFIHGGGNTACETCHNSGSHTTHLSATNAIGPNVSCNSCHDVTNMPYFKSGPDGNGDGNIDLTETTVCDTCHSPDGSFDGVDGAAYGARTNWTNGVYTGNVLTAGKEKWCVSCHDLGTSEINGRQAPDVAGDNINYGYYVSGHGRVGAAQECSACHGLGMDHNFDGQQTYAGDLDNYKQGYRLSDVGGMDPLDIPLAKGNFGDYRPDAYKLCYSCHDEETLMSDTKSHGCYNDPGNPFKNAPAITTQFRNMHKEGHDTGDNDMPANFHADHLIDVGNTGIIWYSDGPGTLSGRSATTCPTCHNPHGDKKSDGSATLAMTAGAYEITHGSDATGDYGEVTSNAYDTSGDPQQRCVVTCHGLAAIRLLNGITIQPYQTALRFPTITAATRDRLIQVLPTKQISG